MGSTYELSPWERPLTKCTLLVLGYIFHLLKQSFEKTTKSGLVSCLFSIVFGSREEIIKQHKERQEMKMSSILIIQTFINASSVSRDQELTLRVEYVHFCASFLHINLLHTYTLFSWSHFSPIATLKLYIYIYSLECGHLKLSIYKIKYRATNQIIVANKYLND